MAIKVGIFEKNINLIILLINVLFGIDVAISAPLEDDRRGAIYIFRVGNNEFRQLQRIAGRDINSSLRGFGHSLAQADIDNNSYNGE